MQVHLFPVGPLGTNCYLVENGTVGVVIDPGGSPEDVVKAIRDKNLEITHIINTHLHFDHIYGNAALSGATGAGIYANPEDGFLMETEVGQGGVMGLPQVAEFKYEELHPGEAEFAGAHCDILHTPGHTPGSLSLYFPQGECVFVGDVIFRRSLGRTDFPGGDGGVLKKTVEEKIFTLPEETRIFPGHMDPTSVGEEKRHNPFFSSFMT